MFSDHQSNSRCTRLAHFGIYVCLPFTQYVMTDRDRYSFRRPTYLVVCVFFPRCELQFTWSSRFGVFPFGSSLPRVVDHNELGSIGLDED